MIYSRKRMLVILENAKEAFSNALKNESMIEMISKFGFTKERLLAAIELYEKADEYFRAKGTKLGYRLSINYQVSQKFTRILKDYRRIRRILKRALKRNIDVINELQFNVPMPRTKLAMIKRIKEFYEVCSKEEHIKARVINYGLTDEVLTAELQQVTEVENGYLEKSLAKMGAEKATYDRNKVLQDLFDEYYILREILIALYGETDPHILEGYGVSVYGDGVFRRIAKKKKKGNEEESPAGNDSDGSGIESDDAQVVKQLPAITS